MPFCAIYPPFIFRKILHAQKYTPICLMPIYTLRKCLCSLCRDNTPTQFACSRLFVVYTFFVWGGLTLNDLDHGPTRRSKLIVNRKMQAGWVVCKYVCMQSQVTLSVLDSDTFSQRNLGVNGRWPSERMVNINGYELDGHQK